MDKISEMAHRLSSIARMILHSFFILLLLSSCTNSRQLDDIKSSINQLKKTYAPDRRTDRFDVDVMASGDQYVISGHTTSVKARDLLLQKLDSVGIVYRDDIITYPDSTVGDQTWAVVPLSVCNIRSEPKHSGELATQELMGTVLNVLSRQDEWYLVQTPNRYIGWLDHGGLVPMTESQIIHWKEQTKHIYMLASGWVYEQADVNSPVVSDIVAGATVIDKNNAVGLFSEVELPDGRSGYLLKGNTLVTSPGDTNDLVATARHFMGVPYLWGGTSSKGFDCSGFSKTIYALHGFLLPRDASQQVRVGILIETDKTWKNLIPGDLLFFGHYREDGSERITHVAMYMGDGKIIHAAGRVKIESLNPKDPDFANDRYDTFIKAKRMVKDGRSLIEGF
jgi:cell wall-associated NlpC family hydrolase